MAILPLSSNAIVVEKDDIKLHINGYVGYKYITSTAKNTAIRSEPELGLDLSLDINNNWSAFTQFTYDSTIDNALVYSFLTYEKVLTENFSFRVDGGKLRHDTALYNNVRINPRTRPGVIVPQAIYWDSLQNILASGNGLKFTMKFNNLEFGYTIDQPIVTDPKNEAFIWTSGLLEEIDAEFGSHQMALLKYSFDEVPLTLKATWTRLDLGNKNTKLLKMVLPEYSTKNQVVEFLNSGFIWEGNTWKFSAESLIVKPFYTEWLQNNSIGYSLTLSKDISEHITLYTNYNKYESNPLRPTVSWYQTTEDINVGLNYHEKNWMIGAEVHHINGGRWVNPSDFREDPTAYKEWWMFGINAVYFF